MDAMHINSKPYTLLPGDWTREREQEQETAAPKRPDSRPSAQGTGFVSGSAPAQPDGRLPPSSSSSTSALPALEPQPPSQPPSPPPYAPPPSRSTPAAFLSPPPDADVIPAASGSDSNGDTSAGLHTSFPPLFVSSGNNTTPETSLIGARGKSIPLGDGSVADRTSALRELNSTYPSPVLRHGYVKSAGAKNTTYSQPVIVRTYSGPSPSPSSSTHYRRPSSGNRHASQPVGSGHARLTPAPAPSRLGISAAHSSKHAHGLGEGSSESQFGMARSSVKKSFIPWQWAIGGGDGRQDDEVKLPPVEAFTYKGFLADLQANTSIRADLDRIAEICAISKYSLSDQYDAHVTPHGSGAAFVGGAAQQPAGRLKGRKKGSSSPGGPTLQAVPSDDDENSTRGHRRRRGGVGGGRRRSAAYGTLETIMSSSRSSEEDKSKKKSAAEIAEEVRGRATQKAENTAMTAADSKPRSKSRVSAERASKEDLASDSAAAPPPPSSRRHGRQVPSRQKPTSFAHAMIDSNRHHLARSDKPKTGAALVESPFPATSPTVALLSDPAVAQTSNNLVAIHTSSNAANSHSRLAEDAIQDQHAASSSAKVVDGHLSPPPSLHEAESAGFLSGLSSWIPWVAVDEAHNGQPASHSHQAVGRPGPSNAEGRLRQLLKAVDGGKPNKGKEIERQN